MKIVCVVGARPQFIKHAPLSKEIAKSHRVVLVHTGQHYDDNMSGVFFEELNIPRPDYNLGVGSGTHAFQTGRMLIAIEDVLMKESPDLVLVYGDTNSTLAGALAAAKMQLKVAHVEAGLRLYDKSIPEEINRQVTDYCSDFLFCPTQAAADNLLREGITEGVHLTGDVMVDALQQNRETAEKSNILEALGLKERQYVLVTLHRAGNTDVSQNLGRIVDALVKLGELGETLVFPVHPRTRRALESIGLLDKLDRVARLTEPQGYFEFLKLMNHSKKIITDSGGIQKEAYILKVPCVTLMDTTTWAETVEDGWNVLAGTDSDRIVQLALGFAPGDAYSDVFGKGACAKIASVLGGG